MKKKRYIILSLLLFFRFLLSHISDFVFDDTQIPEFYLTFEQENYLELLWQNYQAGENEYIPATFEFNGDIYPNVGVRYKGNASCFNQPNQKKPFKIKFNEYNENQEFYGLTKLSLSNQYMDPSFLREKILYDIFNKYLISSRANFIKLYTNDNCLGIYTNVEQVNKKFLRRNFESNDNGNLFKGEELSTLEWLGSNQENYYPYYDLKTNEEENDWSDLIYFIDILDNIPIYDFQESIENVFHIHNWIFFFALNNLFVNLDSYVGKCHNYYVYHRTDSDKFIHIPWDLNLSFGTFGGGVYTNSVSLSIFYKGPMPGIRPLAERFFEIEEYEDLYLMIYQYVMEEELDPDVIYPRIEELADLIRSDVYADTLKLYSNEEFENSLVDDIDNIYGLESFIEQRRTSIEMQFEGLEIPTRIDNIFINEFLANNDLILADEFGEYDDWLEIYNTNEETIDLSGMFLSDNPTYPDKWKFPENTEINAGDFLIVWLDNDPEQGDLHTNFKMNEDGEFIGLYHQDGVLALDSLSFGNQLSDISFGRYPDGSDFWQFMPEPTPGTYNTQGNDPPELSNFQQVPLTPTSSENVNVTIQATDDNYIYLVTLYYSNGGDFFPIYMLDNGLYNDGSVGDGIYGCFIPQQSPGTIISYYIEAEDNQEMITGYPGNDILIEYEVDYIRPSLYINEFLAINRTTNQDPQGSYADWLEIYNAGANAIDIGGLYITDDLTDYSQWYKIPETHPDSTTIPPGDFLLLWADDDEEDGILHLNFNLNGDGEQIGLFAYYGTTPIDTLSYDMQTADISYGRNTDGSPNWEYFTEPTPGFSNSGLESPENIIIYYDNGSIFLEWDEVTGATFYTVYSSSTPDGIFSLEQTGIEETSWEDRDTVNMKKFYIVTAGY